MNLFVRQVTCNNNQLKLMKNNKPKRRGTQSFAGVESLTVQSDKPMTSIRQLLKMGKLPLSREDLKQESFYGDFADGSDFQTHMDRIVSAQQQFDSLPAEIRDRFDNDPAELLDFVSDENNRDEAIELGLVPKPVDVPPSNSVEPSEAQIKPSDGSSDNS